MTIAEIFYVLARIYKLPRPDAAGKVSSFDEDFRVFTDIATEVPK